MDNNSILVYVLNYSERNILKYNVFSPKNEKKKKANIKTITITYGATVTGSNSGAGGFCLATILA